MKECCEVNIVARESKTRRALYWAAILNFSMFVAEIVFGILSKSISLKADSIDFFGDSLNYGVSIWAQKKHSIVRSKVAFLKGLVMFLFGIWLLLECVWKILNPTLPIFETMTWLGLSALLVNITVALILYKYRGDNSNMRSVWLCTRNDVIGNFLVLLAALGVWKTQAQWPDLLVSSIMAALSIHSGWQIIGISKKELAQQK